MPDITMCQGTGCSRRAECYRHRAVPTLHRQSYFLTSPLQADGTCRYFLVLREGDVVAPLQRCAACDRPVSQDTTLCRDIPSCALSQLLRDLSRWELSDAARFDDDQDPALDTPAQRLSRSLHAFLAVTGHDAQDLAEAVEQAYLTAQDADLLQTLRGLGFLQLPDNDDLQAALAALEGRVDPRMLARLRRMHEWNP